MHVMTGVHFIYLYSPRTLHRKRACVCGTPPGVFGIPPPPQLWLSPTLIGWSQDTSHDRHCQYLQSVFKSLRTPPSLGTFPEGGPNSDRRQCRQFFIEL